MEQNKTIIHGLWIGEQLSPIEILCIKSFQNTGHTFYLWTYQPIKNIPKGTIQKDANEMLKIDSIFRYKFTNKFGHGKGSFAGFSDIFRYKLLYEYGGWWTDMDITCLQPLSFKEPYIFRNNGDKGIVGNLMKCEPKSELMNYCYNRASKEINENNKNWMLPITILNDGIINYNLTQYTRELGNEDSWPLVCEFLLQEKNIPKSWYIIHWMNEEWRRLSVDKYAFINNSLIQQLLNKNKVEHKPLSSTEIKKLQWNIGVWKYRWVNIKARLNWIIAK